MSSSCLLGGQAHALALLSVPVSSPEPEPPPPPCSATFTGAQGPRPVAQEGCTPCPPPTPGARPPASVHAGQRWQRHAIFITSVLKTL